MATERWRKLLEEFAAEARLVGREEARQGGNANPGSWERFDAKRAKLERAVEEMQRGWPAWKSHD